MEISEPFVTLIRVAQENPDVRSRLLGILSLDTFNRKSALNTLMEDMRLRGAPKALIEAMAGLLDERVAKKTFEMLGGKE
jgi:hypothetical protein